MGGGAGRPDGALRPHDDGHPLLIRANGGRRLFDSGGRPTLTAKPGIPADMVLDAAGRGVPSAQAAAKAQRRVVEELLAYAGYARK